jgi:hypothetical protein
MGRMAKYLGGDVAQRSEGVRAETKIVFHDQDILTLTQHHVSVGHDGCQKKKTGGKGHNFKSISIQRNP